MELLQLNAKNNNKHFNQQTYNTLFDVETNVL